MKWFYLLHYIFLLSPYWSYSSAEVEDGISIVVSAGKRDCFYRDLKKGDEMDFDLQVISGADVDITVIIRSPSGEELLADYQTTEVSEEIKIEEDGPVEICLDNTFSTFADKVVYFDLGIEEHGRDTSYDETFGEIEKDGFEHQTELMATLAGIGDKFQIIENMQAIMRSRYQRHAYLQDRNLWRVTYFSCLSCFVMLCVGLLQVLLIRNLFQAKAPKGMQSSL